MKTVILPTLCSSNAQTLELAHCQLGNRTKSQQFFNHKPNALTAEPSPITNDFYCRKYSQQDKIANYCKRIRKYGSVFYERLRKSKMLVLKRLARLLSLQPFYDICLLYYNDVIISKLIYKISKSNSAPTHIPSLGLHSLQFRSNVVGYIFAPSVQKKLDKIKLRGMHLFIS